jgi:predicted RND superfamily exporter protein
VREALFRRIALATSHHYRWVFAATAAAMLGVVALFLAYPPKIDSDILALLPQKNPVVEDFRSVTSDFKSLDYLFILLGSSDPERHPTESYEDFADAFAERLRNSGEIEGVEYRLQDYAPLMDQMLPYTMLYLHPKDLGEVASRLSDEAIRAQVARNKRLLDNPASLLTKEIIQYDPFGLFPVFKSHFMGKTRQLKVDISDGYYISQGKDPKLLMIVRPVKPAQDIVFGKKLMAGVRGIEASLRKEWAEEGEDPSPLTVAYGGGYPIAQDDANLIKKDSIVNTVSSFVLVLLVVIWAFRRKSALAYLWGPLLVGLIATFGLAHLLGVTLNSATAGFGALLIGLGIDFSTVLYGRYIEERNRGTSIDDSIGCIMGNTGKGVFLGALTTAGTFVAMLFTSFRGMRQVGLLTATGILCCMATVFILLPAMLYFHQMHKEKQGREPVFAMHSFGFERLGKLAHRHPRATIALWLVLTVIFAWAALGVELEDNIQNLRSPNNKGVNVTQEIGEKFGASLTYMMAAVDGASSEEIVAKSRQVVEAVQPFRKNGDVLFTDAITTYLPTLADQQAVIDAIKADKSGRFSPERVRRVFTEACARQGFSSSFFAAYLDKMGLMLAPERPITYEDLSKGPIKPLLDKFIVHKADGSWRGVVYLYIPEEFKRFEPHGLMAAIKQAVPGARVTGINVLSRELRASVKHDALLAFVIGAVFVVILILLDFRSLTATLYSLLPLTVALIWLLGCLRLMGESLNMMNIFVTTMIVGIGSDYGIYFVHRHREHDGWDMDRVIDECGKPIAIAALTTIAGFGSMSLSSYPGLRSMGYVALLGTLFSMVATLTLLVAILTLREKRDKPLPQAGGRTLS